MNNGSALTGLNSTSSLMATEDFPSKAEGIAFFVAFVLAGVFIVGGNLLTVILFAVNKKRRKNSLFLVISMAFADLMLGAITLPIYIIYFIGNDYGLWNVKTLPYLFVCYFIVDTLFSQASLISATLISVERFYAIYWPLKHRTLSMRAYRIVIFMAWTLAILVSAIYNLLFRLISAKHCLYFWIPYAMTLVAIICGCNIGIWRKSRHRNVTSLQNRALQNQRLTRTLLFVSVLASLCWLPLIIMNFLYFILELRLLSFYVDMANFLNYFNSCVNPIVFALRIPEFKQALGLCCFRRRAAINNDRAAAMTPATKLRTLPTNPSHLNMANEQDVLDTKL